MNYLQSNILKTKYITKIIISLLILGILLGFFIYLKVDLTNIIPSIKDFPNELVNHINAFYNYFYINHLFIHNYWFFTIFYLFYL